MSEFKSRKEDKLDEKKINRIRWSLYLAGYELLKELTKLVDKNIDVKVIKRPGQPTPLGGKQKGEEKEPTEEQYIRKLKDLARNIDKLKNQKITVTIEEGGGGSGRKGPGLPIPVNTYQKQNKKGSGSGSMSKEKSKQGGGGSCGEKQHSKGEGRTSKGESRSGESFPSGQPSSQQQKESSRPGERPSESVNIPEGFHGGTSRSSSQGGSQASGTPSSQGEYRSKFTSEETIKSLKASKLKSLMRRRRAKQRVDYTSIYKKHGVGSLGEKGMEQKTSLSKAQGKPQKGLDKSGLEKSKLSQGDKSSQKGSEFSRQPSRGGLEQFPVEDGFKGGSSSSGEEEEGLGKLQTTTTMEKLYNVMPKYFNENAEAVTEKGIMPLKEALNRMALGNVRGFRLIDGTTAFRNPDGSVYVHSPNVQFIKELSEKELYREPQNLKPSVGRGTSGIQFREVSPEMINEILDAARDFNVDLSDLRKAFVDFMQIKSASNLVAPQRVRIRRVMRKLANLLALSTTVETDKAEEQQNIIRPQYDRYGSFDYFVRRKYKFDAVKTYKNLLAKKPMIIYRRYIKTGRNYWVILDKSGSMGMGATKFADRLLLAAIIISMIAESDPEARFRLTLFDDKPYIIPSDMNKDTIQDIVLDVKPGGGTDYASAIVNTLDKAKEDDVIIIIGDFEDYKLPPESVRRIIQNRHLQGVIIYPSYGNRHYAEALAKRLGFDIYVFDPKTLKLKKVKTLSGNI